MNMTSMSEANNEVHRPGRMKRGKPRLADMGSADAWRGTLQLTGTR